MKLEDLNLVHVSWGDEDALVSLTLGTVLASVWGRCDNFDVGDGVPVVEITDAEMDAEFAEPMWDDVPDYLIRVRGLRSRPSTEDSLELQAEKLLVVHGLRPVVNAVASVCLTYSCDNQHLPYDETGETVDPGDLRTAANNLADYNLF